MCASTSSNIPVSISLSSLATPKRTEIRPDGKYAGDEAVAAWCRLRQRPVYMLSKPYTKYQGREVLWAPEAGMLDAVGWSKEAVFLQYCPNLQHYDFLRPTQPVAPLSADAAASATVEVREAATARAAHQRWLRSAGSRRLSSKVPATLPAAPAAPPSVQQPPTVAPRPAPARLSLRRPGGSPAVAASSLAPAPRQPLRLVARRTVAVAAPKRGAGTAEESTVGGDRPGGHRGCTGPRPASPGPLRRGPPRPARPALRQPADEDAASPAPPEDAATSHDSESPYEAVPSSSSSSPPPSVDIRSPPPAARLPQRQRPREGDPASPTAQQPSQQLSQQLSQPPSQPRSQQQWKQGGRNRNAGVCCQCTTAPAGCCSGHCPCRRSEHGCTTCAPLRIQKCGTSRMFAARAAGVRRQPPAGRPQNGAPTPRPSTQPGARSLGRTAAAPSPTQPERAAPAPSELSPTARDGLVVPSESPSPTQTEQGAPALSALSPTARNTPPVPPASPPPTQSRCAASAPSDLSPTARDVLAAPPTPLSPTQPERAAPAEPGLPPTARVSCAPARPAILRPPQPAQPPQKQRAQPRPDCGIPSHSPPPAPPQPAAARRRPQPAAAAATVSSGGPPHGLPFAPAPNLPGTGDPAALPEALRARLRAGFGPDAEIVEGSGLGDDVWVRRWWACVELRGSLLDIPFCSRRNGHQSRVGRRLVGMGAALLRRANSGELPYAAPLVFKAVVLEKDSGEAGRAAAARLVEARMDAWDRGEVDALVRAKRRLCEARRTAQRPAGGTSPEHVWRVFSRLMLRGQVRQANRWLTQRAGGGGSSALTILRRRARCRARRRWLMYCGRSTRRPRQSMSTPTFFPSPANRDLACCLRSRDTSFARTKSWR